MLSGEPKIEGLVLVFDGTANPFKVAHVQRYGKVAKFAAATVSTLAKAATETDPESKTSTFLYDTNHQITATTNAVYQLVTTNFYDDTGKVTNQWTQGDPNKSWRLYFSPYYSVEQDPAGGRRWFFFDDLKRTTGVRDPLVVRGAGVSDAGVGHRYGTCRRCAGDGLGHRTGRRSPGGDGRVRVAAVWH